MAFSGQLGMPTGGALTKGGATLADYAATGPKGGTGMPGYSGPDSIGGTQYPSGGYQFGAGAGSSPAPWWNLWGLDAQQRRSQQPQPLATITTANPFQSGPIGNAPLGLPPNPTIKPNVSAPFDPGPWLPGGPIGYPKDPATPYDGPAAITNANQSDWQAQQLARATQAARQRYLVDQQQTQGRQLESGQPIYKPNLRGTLLPPLQTAPPSVQTGPPPGVTIEDLRQVDAQGRPIVTRQPGTPIGLPTGSGVPMVMPDGTPWTVPPELVQMMLGRGATYA